MTALPLDPSEQAVAWLLSCYRIPGGDLLARWEESEGVASFPLGEDFDVVLVSLNLGRAAVELLQRSGRTVGPVLENTRKAGLRFFVPAGTYRTWAHPLTEAWGEGQLIMVPKPGQMAAGRFWLVEPDGTGTLTCAADLLDALGEASARLFRTVRTCAR